MSMEPEIRVVTVEYGPLPGASSLNPKFSPERPLLLATLEIQWAPDDPAAAISRLEDALLGFSPGFARHECRGTDVYHVFARTPRRPPGASAASGGASPPSHASNTYDAALALAHLIEHAVIDFQCSIMEERRCSGVTAARRSPPGVFDVMVECREVCIGRCCLALAVAWVILAARGERLGLPEREVLIAARLAHDRRGERLIPPAVARALAWPEMRARRALSALREFGYLVETPYTVNLSGIPEYRVCTG